MTSPTIEREFHPVADIFPMMSDRELADLVADVRDNGLHQPIWLHPDGRIIDGRNRSLACKAAGVEPQTRTYDGPDDNLVRFVVSLNLHRRHLNESQRAMVAARIAGYGHGGDRTSEQAANLPLATQADAAAMVNVSERTVRDAKKVIDRGGPELAGLVTSGEVTVSAAASVAETVKDQIAGAEPEAAKAIVGEAVAERRGKLIRRPDIPFGRATPKEDPTSAPPDPGEAVANAISYAQAHGAEPTEPHADWRKKFMDAIAAGFKMAQFPDADVVAFADDQLLAEFGTLVDTLAEKRGRILAARAGGGNVRRLKAV